MFRFRLLVGIPALCVVVVTLVQCRPRPESATAARPPGYVVTIAPLGAFLKPIVAGRADVHVLLPPGASPHTYEITPADAKVAANATMLMYVDNSLDGWALPLQSPVRADLITLLPADKLLRFGEHSDDGHGHGSLDPHVWLDPDLMRAGIPRLLSGLSWVDPGGMPQYQRNGDAFADELARLDEELATLLAPIKGRGVIQFHPALYYFLERYGIRTAGVVENIAGQEPSPRQIKELADLMAAEKVSVIVTEPQLPDAPVRALAEATGARIARMDPLGGVPGRMTYAELLRYNANALIEAF